MPHVIWDAGRLQVACTRRWSGAPALSDRAHMPALLDQRPPPPVSLLSPLPSSTLCHKVPPPPLSKAICCTPYNGVAVVTVHYAAVDAAPPFQTTAFPFGCAPRLPTAPMLIRRSALASPSRTSSDRWVASLHVGGGRRQRNISRHNPLA
eukprot:GGOE01009793.1.p2 GENE.GGOE01009793.1~~GGOE01009793.1.p2  ORF type:complete len:150 (+),score=0.87 GGOE01009793.1:57-506(+)